MSCKMRSPMLNEASTGNYNLSYLSCRFKRRCLRNGYSAQIRGTYVCALIWISLSAFYKVHFSETHKILRVLVYIPVHVNSLANLQPFFSCLWSNHPGKFPSSTDVDFLIVTNGPTATVDQISELQTSLAQLKRFARITSSKVTTNLCIQLLCIQLQFPIISGRIINIFAGISRAPCARWRA